MPDHFRLKNSWAWFWKILIALVALSGLLGIIEFMMPDNRWDAAKENVSQLVTSSVNCPMWALILLAIPLLFGLCSIYELFRAYRANLHLASELCGLALSDQEKATLHKIAKTTEKSPGVPALICLFGQADIATLKDGGFIYSPEGKPGCVLPTAKGYRVIKNS